MWRRDPDDMPDEMRLVIVISKTKHPQLARWVWGLPYRGASKIVRDILSKAAAAADDGHVATSERKSVREQRKAVPEQRVATSLQSEQTAETPIALTKNLINQASPPSISTSQEHDRQPDEGQITNEMARIMTSFKEMF